MALICQSGAPGQAARSLSHDLPDGIGGGEDKETAGSVLIQDDRSLLPFCHPPHTSLGRSGLGPSLGPERGSFTLTQQHRSKIMQQYFFTYIFLLNPQVLSISLPGSITF